MLFMESDRKVDGSILKLSEIDDVLLKMQCTACTAHRARAYFDTVFEVCITVETKLYAHVRIILSFSIYSGAIKSLENRQRT